MSTIEERLDRIEKKLDKIVASTRKPPNVDLSDPRNNPAIKYMPKFWTGESYEGSCLSACPPQLLDMVARDAMWKAEHPKPGLAPEESERMRKFFVGLHDKAYAWAEHNRKNGVLPTAKTAEISSDDIPF